MNSAISLPNPADLWQGTLQWQPSDALQQQFETLYDAVIAINQTVNLTRITSAEEFWEKHLWDSLQGVAPWLVDSVAQESSLKVVDIGTGGGFPGLPLALVFPRWSVALMDSTRKKITAIEQISQTLGLTNVQFLPDRAEHIGHQPSHRESFDLAVVRAVGPVTTCAEYALPLLALGGRAVLYRGQWSAEEETGLLNVLPRLGGELVDVQAMITPLTQGVRHNVVLSKVSHTPDQFPRSPGIPAKSPLV